VAIAAALVAGGATPAPAQVSDQERLRRAVDYLLASQLPSGFFRYDFDFLADRPVEGDHIVRQVGAAYFLGEHYLHARDQRVRLAIEAALKTFGELSLTIGKSPLQSVLEQARLLSLPIGRYKLRAALYRTGLLYRSTGEGKVVSPDGKYSSAHTGATALGLLAELQYYQVTGGRGFRITPDSINESPFYDGEAWLALAYYHELFPHDESVSALLNSLDTYLMTRYASEVSTGFYQWGTMAAARRLTATSNPHYLNFIRTQALTLLGAPRRDQWRGDNSCAEIEGLATAARVLRAHKDPDGVLMERIRARVNEEMEKNRRLQIPPKATRMMFADGVYLSSPNLRDFSGAFLEGSLRPYTRIDHTLHCVSALIKLTQ